MPHAHHFAPSKPKQEKVSFDCSLPQAVASTKRVTTALPFPTDINEALNYSAAYVDHAAHLAKHAKQQFEYLQKDYSDLSATAEARASKITSLDSRVKTLEEKNCELLSKYAALEKHHAQDIKDAKAREALLKKELADTQAALKASEKTVGLLRKHIVQDKLEDIEREQQHEQHISADHLRIKQAEERAAKAESEVIRLKTSLETTTKSLAISETNLQSTRAQLCKSEAIVSKLTEELEAEKKLKQKLESDLKIANDNVKKANADIVKLRKESTDKDATILAKEKIIKDQDAEIDSQADSLDHARDDNRKLDIDLRTKRAEVNKLQTAHAEELARIRAELEKVKTHHKNEHELKKTNVISNVEEVVDVY